MKAFYSIVFAVSMMVGSSAFAGITFTPYASIKSTKSVNPDKKNSAKENETIKQREEYGFRGGVSFWRLMKFELGIGQSTLTTTEKTQDAVDEYGDIDYEADMNMDTSDPDKEVRITEVQQLGKASLIIDPSFSIFILRAKAGVTARQRNLKTEIEGEDPVTLIDGPKYFPHSGFGAGVKLGYGTYFMAEYEFDHYKFPEIEPFERQLTVSFAVSI